MEITKIEIQKFRKEFNDAVADLSAKKGLAISLENVSYDNSGFKGTVTFENIGEIADGGSIEQAKFKNNAGKYGFNESDYNRECMIYGKPHKLVGFKPNARKNVCIIVSKTGAKYVTDLNTVKNGLV
jgi:hypothetical protein